MTISPKWVDLLRDSTAQAWIKDSAFRFYYANEAFARSVEGAPEDLSGLRDTEIFSRLRSAEFRESDRTSLRQARSIVLHEHGTQCPERVFETVKIPILSPSGRRLAVVGISTDITPYRHVQLCLPHDRQRKPAPEWLQCAVDFLHQDEAGTLTASAIAKNLGIHRETLGRGFQRHCLMQITDYRRWLRARRARQSILRSQETLAQIAAAVGYTDQSHMTRDFQYFVGFSPGTLKEAVRLSSIVSP